MATRMLQMDEDAGLKIRMHKHRSRNPHMSVGVQATLEDQGRRFSWGCPGRGIRQVRGRGAGRLGRLQSKLAAGENIRSLEVWTRPLSISKNRLTF